MRPEDRVPLVRETARVLKPRGRVIVIGAVPRGGLGALFTRAQSGPPFDPQPSLEADGFRFVRLLGEREGLVFVEGLKLSARPGTDRDACSLARPVIAST